MVSKDLLFIPRYPEDAILFLNGQYMLVTKFTEILFDTYNDAVSYYNKMCINYTSHGQ